MDALIDDLVTYISVRDWVTFVELDKFLEERGIETHGRVEITLTDYPNLVLWTGMSQEFVDIFERLVKDKRVKTDGGSALAYFIDGGVPRYPVAKRPPKNGYKEPHWAPTFFRPS